MNLKNAYEIGCKLQDDFSPHCSKCCIAGSVRSGKPEVKDIEIVACPDPSRYADFLAALRRYPIMKGKPTIEARYLRLRLLQIETDVFITTPARWGWILTLRTGSSDFNLALLEALRRHGVTSKDGVLWRDGNAIPTPEEADVFALAGVEFVRPEDRNESYTFNQKQHEYKM